MEKKQYARVNQVKDLNLYSRKAMENAYLIEISRNSGILRQV